jgi:hypothetical protein
MHQVLGTSSPSIRPDPTPAARCAGELNFDTLGVMFQSGSIVTESFRLALVQILLQQRGIKLNPVSTLYYIAPACFGFLTLPFFFIELPKMMADPNLVVQPMWILFSAAAAFGG